MLLDLRVRTVVMSLCGGFLNDPVHSPHLLFRPGVVRFLEAMQDVLRLANAVEDGSFRFAPAARELQAIVGQDSVDSEWNTFDEIAQKLGGSRGRPLLVQFRV